MAPLLPRIGRALAALLLAEVTLVAASIAWVAVYSHWITPGQPMATYHAHAQASGPWVSIIVGVPLFLVLVRWLLRERTTWLLMFGTYLALDAALLLALAPPGAVPWGLAALSYLSKWVAGWLGLQRAAA